LGVSQSKNLTQVHTDLFHISATQSMVLNIIEPSRASIVCQRPPLESEQGTSSPGSRHGTLSPPSFLNHKLCRLATCETSARGCCSGESSQDPSNASSIRTSSVRGPTLACRCSPHADNRVRGRRFGEKKTKHAPSFSAII